MNLAPQLAFAGECRPAFEFYATLLGGEITVMNTFGGNEDRELPPGSVAAAADQIRFAEISFGDSALRGNDVPADSFTPRRSFNVSLHTNSVDDARRIFNGLADGGDVTTPLSKVDWADLFGTVVDRFGVPWLILALSEDRADVRLHGLCPPAGTLFLATFPGAVFSFSMSALVRKPSSPYMGRRRKRIAQPAAGLAVVP